jgi:hypothetical protein
MKQIKTLLIAALFISESQTTSTSKTAHVDVSEIMAKMQMLDVKAIRKLAELMILITRKWLKNIKQN